MNTTKCSANATVMVRSFGDKPVELVAWGRHGSAVLVSKADSRPEIGFPGDSVFHYDLSLFGRLVAAYDARDQPLLVELWREAQAYSDP